MASVFVLGPSQWRKKRWESTPLEIRQRLVELLSEHHDAYILEPLTDDASDRDLTDKFYRTLRDRMTTDIVLFWPLGAKMQTTLDEIVLLRARMDGSEAPTVWMLHQKGVLKRTAAGYEIPAGVVERSRYLDAVNTLGAAAYEWRDTNEIFELARRLGDNLATSA